jgi:hypothetical protein
MTTDGDRRNRSGPGKEVEPEPTDSYAQIAALPHANIAHLEKNVIKYAGCIKRNNRVGQVVP